ncbi:hypothetical protein Tco_1024793, partial [Tanacetum coccineum]
MEDMTIVEYLEYEKKVNKNHISDTKSYLLPILANNDMEEGVEYMTDDEVVMSEQEESNHGYTQNIQHFEEKDDVNEWLNVEITKYMTALIDVNAAQSKLVVLENFNENYSKCLRLLYKVNDVEGVNAASEEVSTAEL